MCCCLEQFPLAPSNLLIGAPAAASWRDAVIGVNQSDEV